jgi:hypothetical protein
MKSRRLTAAGMSLFEHHLQGIRNGENDPSRLERLRDDAAYSEPFHVEMNLSPQVFTKKKALAEYVVSVLKSSGLTSLPKDPGLWSWLAVFFFESLLPSSGRRSQAIREDARYVYNPAYNRYRRHRIAGPVTSLWVHQDAPESVDILLYGRPYEWSDFEAQILDRNILIQNRTVVALATLLYYDKSSETLKKRSLSYKSEPGNLRRLLRILSQFRRTYDLYSVETKDMYEKLPAEFDQWKSNS